MHVHGCLGIIVHFWKVYIATIKSGFMSMAICLDGIGNVSSL